MDATTFERAVHARFVSSDPIYLIVPALWMAMQVVNYVLFHAGKDATARRECYSRSVRLNAGFFVILTTIVSVIEQRSLKGLWALVLLIPGAFLIASVIINETKFCHQCDSMVRQQWGTTAPPTCQTCGTLLGGYPDLPDEL